MPGETVSDQRIQSPEESYKVNVFIFSLDTVTSQLQERFTVQTVRLMKEMQIFSTNALSLLQMLPLVNMTLSVCVICILWKRIKL